ncbi:MAG: type II secretion system major pseudopilin GspG [Pseudomonadota bacterium]
MKTVIRAPLAAARGFSLIEILVVLVILGLLAGLVLPNVYSRLSGAKSKAAKTQIVVIQNGVDGFMLDVGRLPNSLNELVEAPGDAEFWNGPYVRKQALKDPWQQEWVYRKPGQGGAAYDILSYGEDGSPGGEGNNRDVSNAD